MVTSLNGSLSLEDIDSPEGRPKTCPECWQYISLLGYSDTMSIGIYLRNCQMIHLKVMHLKSYKERIKLGHFSNRQICVGVGFQCVLFCIHPEEGSEAVYMQMAWTRYTLAPRQC